MFAPFMTVRVAVALVVSVGLFLASEVRAAAPADLAPKDAALYLGWTAAPKGLELVRLAGAIFGAPAVRAEFTGDPTSEALPLCLPILDRITRHTGALVLISEPGKEHAPQRLDYGLIVDAGSDAPALASELKSYLTALYPGRHVDEQTVGSATFTRLSNEGGAPGPMWAVHPKGVVLAENAQMAALLVARLDGAGPPISEQPKFKSAMQKLEPSDKGWSLSFYMDAKLQLDAAASMPADDPSAAFMKIYALVLGFAGGACFAALLDEVDYGTRISTYTASNPGGLWGKLATQPALTDADIALIPKDALMASLFNLDLVLVWDELLNALDDADPTLRGQVTGALAAASAPLGFSLVDDLLPVFGDTWCLYDAPSHAGVLFSGFVAIADVKDREKLDGMLTRLVDFIAGLAAESPAKVTLKRGQFDGREISYVLIGGLPIPVAPAWGYVDNRWVFGLFPQTVAVAMNQADAKTRKSSLFDNPDYKAALPLLPPKAAAVSYVDAAGGARSWYGLALLARTAAASASIGSSQPFDLASVPPFPKSQGASVRSLVCVSAIERDGVISRSVGASPQTLVMSPLGSFTGAALGASIMIPSLARARELSKRAVSAANLRGITMGLLMHASDHGDQFPATLDELIADGIVTPAMLKSPRDPAPDKTSYVYIAGQDPKKGDARNVIVYEKPWDDEGTNVAFLDGHVEWMKLDAFRSAVRDTYKRLGREGELPAELRESGTMRP